MRRKGHQPSEDVTSLIFIEQRSELRPVRVVDGFLRTDFPHLLRSRQTLGGRSVILEHLGFELHAHESTQPRQGRLRIGDELFVSDQCVVRAVNVFRRELHTVVPLIDTVVQSRIDATPCIRGKSLRRVVEGSDDIGPFSKEMNESRLRNGSLDEIDVAQMEWGFLEPERAVLVLCDSIQDVHARIQL
jgi:hypothetical protein